MPKMEKLSKSYIDAQYVKAVMAGHPQKKCIVKFITEPEKKKSEKFGNEQYHVDVQCPEVEVLERNEDGKPTKYGTVFDRKIKMTWTMNTRSSDFLGEKYGDTEDFIGEECELGIAETGGTDGAKDRVYPMELIKEWEGSE